MYEQPPSDDNQLTQAEVNLLATRDVDSQAKLLKWFVNPDDMKDPFGFRKYLSKAIPLSNYQNELQLDVVDKFFNVIEEYHSVAVSLKGEDAESANIREALFELAIKRFARLRTITDSYRGQKGKERELAATSRLEKSNVTPRQSSVWGR